MKAEDLVFGHHYILDCGDYTEEVKFVNLTYNKSAKICLPGENQDCFCVHPELLSEISNA